eukprot:gene10290-1859_t
MVGERALPEFLGESETGITLTPDINASEKKASQKAPAP